MGFLFETAPMDATDPPSEDGTYYIGPPYVDPETGEIKCKNGKPPGEDGKCYSDDDAHTPAVDDDKKQAKMGQTVKESLGLDYETFHIETPMTIVEKSVNQALSILYEAYDYIDKEVIFVPLGNTAATEFSAKVTAVTETAELVVLKNDSTLIMEVSPLFRNAFVLDNVHYKITPKGNIMENKFDPETGLPFPTKKSGLNETQPARVKDFLGLTYDEKPLNESIVNKKSNIQAPPVLSPEVPRKLNESDVKKFFGKIKDKQVR